MTFPNSAGRSIQRVFIRNDANTIPRIIYGEQPRKLSLSPHGLQFLLIILYVNIFCRDIFEQVSTNQFLNNKLFAIPIPIL